MKILVIGGSGLIGKQVSSKLIDLGHEVVIGAPSKGVDILTGEGLNQSLKDTEVVIDLSNSSSPDEQTALDFFSGAATNLIPAEKAANIKHHLILSIVGTDRAQFIGYLRAKKIQEDSIRDSGIPYTVIRSTQFHEHIGTIVEVQGNETEVHVSSMDYQPIAAAEVVDFVVKFALEEPKNAIVEIAGPELGPMNEFVDSYLQFLGDEKVVVANDENKYMFYVMPRTTLVPISDFHSAKITFKEWMDNTLKK